MTEVKCIKDVGHVRFNLWSVEANSVWSKLKFVTEINIVIQRQIPKKSEEITKRIVCGLVDG